MTNHVCLIATSLQRIMPVKDYYKILGLSPGAGDAEVKSNFRKLAIRYHPDKNSGKSQEDAWYREIQEAYQVLIDPVKKTKYLQDRWLLKSRGISFEETFPLTPEYIELRFRSMANSVKNMDHFRMDHYGLQKQLLQLCNDETLDALNEYHEPHINQRIIHQLMYCMEPLAYTHIHLLRKPMNQICRKQPQLLNEVNEWFSKRKRQDWWERKQGWVIAILTMVACVGIALLTKMT